MPPAALSVIPYPSRKTTLKATRIKSFTESEIGADPLNITRHRSRPSCAATFENTSLSHSPCSIAPVVRSASSFVDSARAKSERAISPFACAPPTILS